MAELWLSNETPLCIAAMQAHNIASDVAAPKWARDALEQITTKLANYDQGTTVSIPDTTLRTALRALSELEDTVVCPYRRETIEVTKSMMERSQQYAAHRPAS